MFPITLQTKIIIAAVLAGLLALFALAAGIGATYWIMKRPPPKAETYAPGITNPDGSVVGERTPPAEKLAPPAYMLPAKSVETRRGHFTVSGGAPVPPPATAPAGTKATCPDVAVDLSISRMPDGSSRVTAYSPGHSILGFKDIPIALLNQDYDHKNAIGISYDTLRRQTIWYEHDFARLRVGADVFREPDLTGRYKPGAAARVGFTF